jgi:hypothetical protein
MSLVMLREVLVEILRSYELQHGISQELQPLIRPSEILTFETVTAN